MRREKNLAITISQNQKIITQNKEIKDMLWCKHLKNKALKLDCGPIKVIKFGINLKVIQKE